MVRWNLDSDELEINLIGIRTLAGDFLGLEVEFERIFTGTF